MFRLHVTPKSLEARVNALKVLLAASATKQLESVGILAADIGRIPFERLVALEGPTGRFLFSANEAARMFALSSSDGGVSVGASTPSTDEWLAWEV